MAAAAWAAAAAPVVAVAVAVAAASVRRVAGRLGRVRVSPAPSVSGDLRGSDLSVSLITLVSDH